MPAGFGGIENGSGARQPPKHPVKSRAAGQGMKMDDKRSGGEHADHETSEDAQPAVRVENGPCLPSCPRDERSNFQKRAENVTAQTSVRVASFPVTHETGLPI